MKKLLLHSCCGPCSTHVIKALSGKYDLTIFYFNPNIFPFEEYQKRLSAFSKIEIVETKEFNELKNVDLIKEKEGEEILRHITGFPILLDRLGDEVSSEDFAKIIQKISLQSSSVTFIVGGSYGVSDAVKKVAKKTISFSKLTFPHNLFRVMLLEQIYRAFTIIQGKKYHK